MKCTFLILSFFLNVVIAWAQTSFVTSNNYKFVEINDSTTELCVSINGLTAKTNYLRTDNSLLPTFHGKYKDSMIFILGYGQHFRLLTVFQIYDGKIIRDDIEHVMCLNNNSKESYLFFYGEQPIKMVYDYKSSKVKYLLKQIFFFVIY